MLRAFVHPSSTAARCLSALEPRRWPKLVVAALLGQAIGVVAAERFDPVAAVIGFAFTLLALGFAVLLRAWLDRDLDALKRRLDPEGEVRRTIPDRILEGRSVWQLGFGLAAFALSAAVVAEIVLPRPGAWWGAVAVLSLFAVPMLPPVKLAHRGAGELLDMLAVGFAVPWWNAYLQSGIAAPAELAFLPGLALFAFSTALASGLPDEHADRLGGNITFTTLFGAERVRMAAEGMLVGGMLVWAAMSKLAPHIAAWWTTAPAVLLMSWLQRDVAQIGRSADIDEPHTLARYQAALQRCTLAGEAVLAFTLLAHLWIHR